MRASHIIFERRNFKQCEHPMTDDQEPKENKTERVQVLMTPSEVETIDDWSFANRIRSRSEAIRRLCQIGFIADTHRNDFAEFIKIFPALLYRLSTAEHITIEEAKLLWRTGRAVNNTLLGSQMSEAIDESDEYAKFIRENNIMSSKYNRDTPPTSNNSSSEPPSNSPKKR